MGKTRWPPRAGFYSAGAPTNTCSRQSSRIQKKAQSKKQGEIVWDRLGVLLFHEQQPFDMPAFDDIYVLKNRNPHELSRRDDLESYVRKTEEISCCYQWPRSGLCCLDHIENKRIATGKQYKEAETPNHSCLFRLFVPEYSGPHTALILFLHLSFFQSVQLSYPWPTK